jgi:hypothetical protein
MFLQRQRRDVPSKSTRVREPSLLGRAIVRPLHGRSGRLGAVNADLANDTLPALSWIGPSDDGGDTALGGEVDPVLGDAFLRDWVAEITSSTAYHSGTTAILITWDEGDFTHASGDPAYQNVPLIAVAPSIATGTATSVPMNHYAVLRAAESMLGLPPLGAAGDPTTPDLRTLLGF